MQDRSKRRFTRWLWVLGGLVGIILGVLVLVVGPWLLTRQPDHQLTVEQELTAENNVRSTLVQALGGIALAGGLIVTYHTYQQNRKEQNRTYKLRQDEQLNEFYAKAVEQLGSDKAPVRLGALYALERLAENNSKQRPIVVDVFCAYLRMPYGALKESPASDAPDAEQARFRERAQELEVRLTAQGILAKHLRSADKQFFWEGSLINLSGAVLINLDFRSCRLLSARFLKTRFYGLTIFYDANFEGDASFAGADFDPETGVYVGEVKWFSTATGFDGARFDGEASFYECSFRGSVTFNQSTFCKGANFSKAKFRFVPRRKIFSGPERLDVTFNDARVACDTPLDSSWPLGWKVLSDTGEPAWGRLSVDFGAASADSSDHVTR